MTLNGYTISTGFILSRPDWYLQMTHWFEVSFYRLVVGLITEYYPQTNLLTLEDVFVFLLVICDLTSSPSKLVFASIFLFLGFYHPFCAHISSKEDPHTFLAPTKSWKRGKFWCSSLHPTHNACSDFFGLSLVQTSGFSSIREHISSSLSLLPQKSPSLGLRCSRYYPSPSPCCCGC